MGGCDGPRAVRLLVLHSRRGQGRAGACSRGGGTRWCSLSLSLSPVLCDLRAVAVSEREATFDVRSLAPLFAVTPACSMRLHALSGALLLLRSLAATPPSEAITSERYDERLRLTSFAQGKVESEFAFLLQGPWRDQGIRLAQSTHGQRPDCSSDAGRPPS